MHERVWNDGKQKVKKNVYWQHSEKEPHCMCKNLLSYLISAAKDITSVKQIK